MKPVDCPRESKPRIRVALMLLTAGTAASCARSVPQAAAQTRFPVPSAVAPPVVRYSLCDEGLPRSGMWKCDPVFKDINGDGNLDLAATPRKGNGPRVWFGDGTGRWQAASTGLQIDSSCGGGVALGDVNRDGFIDLALADHCHGLFVFLGDGAGKWQVTTRGLYPEPLARSANDADAFRGSEDLDLGDVNGDGALDIVAGATDEGGVALFLGDGTGKNWKFSPSKSLPPQGLANRVRFADTNADGYLDIVAAYNRGPRVWHGDGHGNFTAASDGLPEPIATGLYRGIDVGDVNGDGIMDLVTANWVDGPELYFQSRDGRWTKAPDVFPEMLGGAVGITLADIDGDKDLDIVTSGRLTQNVGFVYGVFVLLGDGRGGFTPLKRSGLLDTGLAFTWGVAVGDVNKDSVLDIVAGSGGLVATVPGPEEPVIATRLPVWCGSR